MPPPNAKDAINEALELMNRRWVARIVWELRESAMTFRALQQSCGEVSPTVLNQRLAELRDSGLVSHEAGSGYALTEDGHALVVALQPFTQWAVGWWRRRQTKR